MTYIETMEVNRNGTKVIINKVDFNSEIETPWEEDKPKRGRPPMSKDSEVMSLKSKADE